MSEIGRVAAWQLSIRNLPVGCRPNSSRFGTLALFPRADRLLFRSERSRCQLRSSWHGEHFTSGVMQKAQIALTPLRVCTQRFLSAAPFRKPRCHAKSSEYERRNIGEDVANL